MTPSITARLTTTHGATSVPPSEVDPPAGSADFPAAVAAYLHLGSDAGPATSAGSTRRYVKSTLIKFKWTSQHWRFKSIQIYDTPHLFMAKPNRPIISIYYIKGHGWVTTALPQPTERPTTSLPCPATACASLEKILL